MTESLEQEARRLRAEIYGECTDNNWAACREAWMSDIEWLRRRVQDYRNGEPKPVKP